MTKRREASTPEDPRRSLPAVGAILAEPALAELLARHPRIQVLAAVQQVLDRLREELTGAAGPAPPGPAEVAARTAARIGEEERPRLRPVVNATGILLHTGLGRAVLPAEAAAALARLDRCCNLQIDLDTGLRGKRDFMAERLLCRLTGAEAAALANNNAAATLLMLGALAEGREVIVSRGQLIEIGGSYRLPDCIHRSGARLVEVGTTNRTHLRDYEAALTPQTAAVLRCNASNYRVVGFHKEVAIGELASLKEKRPELLVLDDLGCGALIDLGRFGLPHEPTVQESLQAGADLVCFSGDKLIGGPQAGIILGRRDLVQRIRKHPLARMLRVGKLTDMALEATLRLFLEPETLVERHPTLRMLATPAAVLKARAAGLAGRLAPLAPRLVCRAEPLESATGGGSLPAVPIPSWGLAVTSPEIPADRILLLLRRHEPPVIARIEAEEVRLDLRTLLPGEEETVAAALAWAAGHPAPE